MYCSCTDLNSRAAELTQATGDHNGVHLNVVITDLVSMMSTWWVSAEYLYSCYPWCYIRRYRVYCLGWLNRLMCCCLILLMWYQPQKR